MARESKGQEWWCCRSTGTGRNGADEVQADSRTDWIVDTQDRGVLELAGGTRRGAAIRTENWFWNRAVMLQLAHGAPAGSI